MNASSQVDRDGIVELTADVSDSPYYNADMAPTTVDQRTWGVKDFTVLWISMSACITTYFLASSLIDGGMDWRQAILTIFLGNVIVLLPMVLNAHAGTKYGIPFPVYCRASFGIRGANVPAVLRAIVACGWFGIQTWIGGDALYVILRTFAPGAAGSPEVMGWGVNAAQLGCFFVFWLVNMAVVYNGIESIRVLLNIKAPLLVLLGIALLAWAYDAAGGFGEMLSKPSEFAAGRPRADEFWGFFILALTGNVSYWATLALNIPDFSRYARSQRDQVVGQALGLPTTMAFFSFIGVAVTSAAMVIYKDLPDESKAKLWDPIFLLGLFENRVVLVVAMTALALATLATNIAANVVSPANDFIQLWPRRINFQIGGLITGLIGIAIRPWYLVSNSDVYYQWLIGYSLLLGAVGGVLIADYIVLRRTKLDLAGLYRKDGPYWYVNGVNPIALAALLAGMSLCVPGFLATVGVIWLVGDSNAPPGAELWPRVWGDLYRYAWFTSFGTSFLMYVALMSVSKQGRAMEHAP